MTAPRPWRVIEEPTPATGDATHRPAMDLDPRGRTIHFGFRPVTGGGPEISSGAVARTFFARDVIDWSRARTWLDGDEAAALLQTILEGHAVETLWSGDLHVTWSDDAWRAGSLLFARLSALLDETP